MFAILLSGAQRQTFKPRRHLYLLIILIIRYFSNFHTATAFLSKLSPGSPAPCSTLATACTAHPARWTGPPTLEIGSETAAVDLLEVASSGSRACCCLKCHRTSLTSIAFLLLSRAIGTAKSNRTLKLASVTCLDLSVTCTADLETREIAQSLKLEIYHLHLKEKCFKNFLSGAILLWLYPFLSSIEIWTSQPMT